MLIWNISRKGRRAAKTKQNVEVGKLQILQNCKLQSCKIAKNELYKISILQKRAIKNHAANITKLQI